jgi:membrane protease YdiL (CAAX protease family)
VVVLLLLLLPVLLLTVVPVIVPGWLPSWMSQGVGPVSVPAGALLVWGGQLLLAVLYAVLRSTVTRGRGRVGAALAWLVIFDLVGVVLYRNAERNAPARGEVSSAWLVNVEQQGRYLVGATRLVESLSTANKAKTRADMAQAAKSLDKGTYSQRLRYAVVAGELERPDKALEALDRLEKERREGKIEARDISIKAAQLLRRLYRGYEADPKAPPMLDEADQDFLRKGLGWFGDLALAPEGSATQAQRDSVMAPALRTAWTYLIVAAGFCLGFLAGLGLILLLAVRLFLGKTRSRIAVTPGHGSIYAETFALYMLFYFGITLVVGLLAQYEPIRRVVGSMGLLLSAVAMFLSLVVLAWPVLRGISWRQVRDDLGLRLGNRPLLNVVFGPITYLCALPLLALGIVIMLGLMFLMKRYGLGTDPFEPGAGPSHPIIGVALQKNWWVWAEVFLVAAVAAPIVEEVMFRGILYGHLRDWSASWGRWLSIPFSVLWSGFIFAVIHPQGWLAVPALMLLASAFALAREWRGSLMPSMIAHGLNNGVLMLLLMLTVG